MILEKGEDNILIVFCGGGLGNQMFQYAFYLKLKILGKNVKFYTNYFNRHSVHNGYELEKVFNIKNKDICEYQVILYKLLNKMGLKNICYYQSEPKDAIRFKPDVFNNNWQFLIGYWQSEKYFQDISDIVKKRFTFSETLDKRNNEIKNLMLKENSVSIHIRRGDYLKEENKCFQNICTKIYYENAVEYINKYVDNPCYYVFSNDIEWCKHNLKLENATYIDFNKGNESYKDMQLMSCCKHNIIANSSFSWWGAWLNKNPSKIVCVPEYWFNLQGCESNDVAPLSWIRIPIK